MIQNIAPHVYHNEFHNVLPKEQDKVLCYRKGQILLHQEDGCIRYPKYEEVAGKMNKAFIYLFSIDQTNYFLGQEVGETEEYSYEDTGIFRKAEPGYEAFAGITGLQLDRWYRENRFCSVCQTKMEEDKVERMVFCPSCGHQVYPKIMPAVIVAVVNQDRLLVTKYAGRAFHHFALIAGFNEIGESIEDTVHREVMEEVGLKVKNLKFYKSQPWSFSDTLLFGFFAELDGSPDIKLDQQELAEGVWLTREELPDRSGEISLTSEMMQLFKTGCGR